MAQRLPKRLVFSPNDPIRRKRSFILFWIVLTLQMSVIWPVYSYFASPTPQVLGFPLSFAWTILIILLSFTTLVIFYLFDTANETEA